MKRALIVLLGVLLLAVAVGWGVWAYRQHVSYRTPIPQNATLVVKANVDALLRDIAWNALWNRDYYDGLRSDEQPRFDRKRMKHSGVSIPANIFLYRIPELESCYFGTLKVSNAATLRHFLTHEWNMDSLTHDATTLFHAKPLMVALTNHRVAFAITSSTSKPLDTTQVLMALVTIADEQNMVSIADSRFTALRNGGEHFALMGDGFSGTLKAENGHIRMSAKIHADVPETSFGRPDFPIGQVASLWLNMGLENLLREQYRMGEYQLAADSLLAHYRGALSLEWRGMTPQMDTTITYDYNDDFELEEKVELIERQVPELYLSIHADTAGLSRYLRTQGLLNVAGDAVSRDAFPLYQLKVSRIGADILQFHTAAKETDLPVSTLNNNEQFYLDVDVQKMASGELSPLLSRYMQPFDHIMVVGHAMESNQVAIQGSLTMANPRINGFVQLVSAF